MPRARWCAMAASTTDRCRFPYPGSRRCARLPAARSHASVGFRLPPRGGRGRWSLTHLNPEIAETHFAGAFDLNPDQAVLAELGRVVVDEDRHHVPVDDVNHLVAARDDVDLVPVVDLDVAAEFVLVAQRGQQARLLALFRPYHLTAPGHDAERGAAFVIPVSYTHLTMPTTRVV